MGTNIIYNMDKLRRPVDFSGLPHVGSCSPTDIDAPELRFCIEVGSMRKYLIGDFKESGKDLTVGQRILIERHVGAFVAYGYTAVGFLAWHPVDANVIDAAESLVSKIYFSEHWRECQQDLETLKARYVRFFNLKENG